MELSSVEFTMKFIDSTLLSSTVDNLQIIWKKGFVSSRLFYQGRGPQGQPAFLMVTYLTPYNSAYIVPQAIEFFGRHSYLISWSSKPN